MYNCGGCETHGTGVVHLLKETRRSRDTDCSEGTHFNHDRSLESRFLNPKMHSELEGWLENTQQLTAA